MPQRGQAGMCLLIGVLGVVIRAKTIIRASGTSGRNTSEGQVAESLNTRGMYSLVRHPLYLGNYFMWMALVLATGRLDFALIVTLAYMMYYLRIAMAEEAFLAGKFGEKYQVWAATVPAFVPILGTPRSSWALAGNAFSCVTRSSVSITGCLRLCLACSFSRRPERQGWACLHGIQRRGKRASEEACRCLFLRFLKKRTQVLHVEGREFSA